MTESEWIAFFRRPEISAFNAMMLDDPDNDLPRLVFADWVEESCPSVPFVMALRRSIAGPETPEWVPNFSMVVKGYELRLWRGRIVVGIDVSDQEFNYEADEFVNAAWESGWVGRVKVRGLTDGFLRLAMLLSASRTRGIEFLDLFDNRTSRFGWWLSSRSSELPHLAEIDLRLNPFEAIDIERLANSPALGSLKRLLLTDGFLSSVDRQVLAESPYLPEHIRARFRPLA